VETPIGVVTRTIPNASPLRQGDPPGTAAEAAIRDAAAVWGLPDFVYRGQRERAGSGSRELGDGLLVVGDLGVVVQVKSREAPGQSADREQRWLHKSIAAALRQADGTVRRLERDVRELANARGRQVRVGGAGVRWTSVVVSTTRRRPTTFCLIFRRRERRPWRCLPVEREQLSEFWKGVE